MSDDIESLLIEVRAGTEGFTRDIARMRAAVDGDLVTGFARAGDTLEKSLAAAVRSGGTGFGDLRRVAGAALDDIAAQASRVLAAALGGGTASAGGQAAASLSGLFAGLLDLPGRATGGPVSPGRGYVVGESGPELFVPAAAGRIEATPAVRSAPARDVRVAITLATPRGADAPQALRRSSRQVASAVRRALQN